MSFAHEIVAMIIIMHKLNLCLYSGIGIAIHLYGRLLFEQWK